MYKSDRFNLSSVKNRMISGVVTLTLRTFFVQAFTFFATFVLTVLLDPAIFGVFFIVSAILNLFVYFSDVGLAAALIQKHEEPTEDDLKTAFTIQQIVVLALVAVGIIFSSQIARFYNLDQHGLLLLRMLIFSLVLSSLKTIPSIILERHLKFTKLIIPQIAENLVFYSLAILLAMRGFGLASFTWAVLARGITGLILIYIISPWKPSFSLSWKTAKKLTTFGIPFQLNSVLALLKDDLLTVFIGKILPYNQVGYIGWAQKFAFVPLRFFMDNVIKVTFPAFSRLQNDVKELSSAIEKSVFFVCFFVYPSIFGIFTVAPYFVQIIPKYQKWEPALPALYLLGINAMFAAVNTTLTNVLFAIGKPKIVLKLMMFWTFLTWVLTYFLAVRYGFVGVALASTLVAASTTAVVFYVKQNLPVNISKNVFQPLLASLIMFIITKILAGIIANSTLGLITVIVSGVTVYTLLSVRMLGRNIIGQARLLFKAGFQSGD